MARHPAPQQHDLLDGATWRVASAAPGTALADVDLAAATEGPRAPAGALVGAVDELLDQAAERDWWFVTEVDVPAERAGRARLSFDGVATVWSAIWDDDEVASGSSMFRSAHADIALTPGPHRLSIGCRSLAAEPVPRKPRAQWRSNLLDNRFRWFRTAALGRIDWPGSAPVIGPWLPVRLTRAAGARLDVRLEGDGGIIDLACEGEGRFEAHVTCGERSWTAERVDSGALSIAVGKPEHWWPHGYGQPVHYRVRLTVNGEPLLDTVAGFRRVSADRSGDGFTLVLNDVPVFARGACWVPVDPLDLAGTPAADEAALRQLRDGGANMIRITGTASYLPPHFHRLCVELGLMVWHDLMLHTLAPPEDPAWLADFEAEVREQLHALRGLPHLVVLSGGSETEQQPVLWGLPPEKQRTSALDEVVPRVVAEVLGESVVHVTSSPTGGWRPTSLTSGIAHYFGVGAYCRPLVDARTSGLRFAAECLAFGVPAERATVSGFGSATTRADAGWLRGIAKDPSADWDFEQVLAWYTRELFGVDVDAVRAGDPARGLDLLRATAAEVFERTGSQWRRAASTNAGALVLSARDLTAGAGWGLIDSAGRPKASWWGLRRAWLPRALLLIDEGLDSVAVHLVNDTAEPWRGTLSVSASDDRGVVGEPVTRDVVVPPRGERQLWVEELMGGFRDLTHAWGFGPARYDAVSATLTDEAGQLDACLLTPPRLRRVGHGAEEDGLHARLVGGPEGWRLRLGAERTAAFVAIEAGDFRPADNWFHLAGGTTREIALAAPPGGAAGAPSGTIRRIDGPEVAFSVQ